MYDSIKVEERFLDFLEENYNYSTVISANFLQHYYLSNPMSGYVSQSEKFPNVVSLHDYEKADLLVVDDFANDHAPMETNIDFTRLNLVYSDSLNHFNLKVYSVQDNQ